MDKDTNEVNPVVGDKELNNRYQERIEQLEEANKNFFEKVDRNSRIFFAVIISLCMLILIFSIIYVNTKVSYDKNTKIYTAKSRNKIYDFTVSDEDIYTNSFKFDSEEINIKKENDISSLIYTETSNLEESENFNIQADLPNINISSELGVKEFDKIKEKIIQVSERIQTIRTVFEGNNSLKFNYYAYYYQDVLSFGYKYHESFEGNVIDEDESFIFNSKTNKMMTFEEYLKLQKFNEDKVSEALKEIIRREKLKHRYNKKSKSVFIREDGTVGIYSNDERHINMLIREK